MNSTRIRTSTRVRTPRVRSATPERVTPHDQPECERERNLDCTALESSETALAETTEKSFARAGAIGQGQFLLIVEDDSSLRHSLAKAMETRGFTVMMAASVSDALFQVETAAPAFAVVDLRLADGNGLDIVAAIKARRPEARAVVLTGYGNLATAVNAIKRGAFDYLAKPADADDVVAVLLARDHQTIAPPEKPLSVERVRWEHIRCVHEFYGCNISETARRLGMHRRTLQRILARYDREFPGRTDLPSTT
jgi:two-component system, response regulator RegA